jgi:methionine salvage enolase-phosphatase E1
MLEEARDAIIAASEEFGIEVNCNNGQIRITPEQREQLKSSLDSILSDFGVNTHTEEIKEEILRWFALASRVSLLDTTGMSVKDIEYEMIKDLHPCLWAINYSSGMIGASTFKEYREAVDKQRANWLAQFEEWKRYNEKNGLPRK